MTSAVLGSASKYTFETFVIGSSNGPKLRYVSSEEFTNNFINMIRPRPHHGHQCRQEIRSLMAERRSIYTQVTELTNRIKQHARTS